MLLKPSDHKYWYAYRIYHNKIQHLKVQLEAEALQYFIPMHLSQKEEENVISYSQIPIIPNLIFIRSTETYIKSIKEKYSSHISVYCTPGTRKPAPIPDQEMEVFMSVLSKGCRRLEVIDESLIKGNHVRITGGLFEGADGYIVRVHGTKRFVVMIKGVAAIATTFIPACFIERI